MSVLPRGGEALNPALVVGEGEKGVRKKRTQHHGEIAGSGAGGCREYGQDLLEMHRD